MMRWLFAPVPKARIAAFRTLVYIFIPLDLVFFSAWIKSHGNLPGNLYQPLVVGDLLFYWNDTGTVTCADAASGKKRWEKRVGRDGFYASPVCVDGKVYDVSKAGEVICFAASGDDYHELGRSRLPVAGKKEVVHATPAVAKGRMVFRTFNQLMSVGGNEERLNHEGAKAQRNTKERLFKYENEILTCGESPADR